MKVQADTMASPIKPKKWTILCVVFCLMMLMYCSLHHSCFSRGVVESYAANNQYSVWPQFTVKTTFTSEYFSTRCVTMPDKSITNLMNDLKLWSQAKTEDCRDLYHHFTAMFTVSQRPATLILPSPFQKKVKEWLGGSEQLFKQVYKQEVIHIQNRFTREYTVFNPLRDKRPIRLPSEPEKEYIERMNANSKESCDFCMYRNFTAEHVNHRLESALSYSASNTFKLDTWHALFMMKAHHPTQWTKTQFMDLMQLSLQWFSRANRNASSAQYPVIVWDLFQHAGASQIHPHMHGLLSPDMYQGVVETWREGAEEYYRQFGTNYFSDLVSIYSALGLAVRHGDAMAFANLVPKKDHEVIVMSLKPGTSFLELIYYTLRAFLDDMEKFSFSLGIGLPPFGTLRGNIPAYARIVTRGALAEVRTDMSSLELFAGTNVNIDPYSVIKAVKYSIRKRHPST